MNNTALIQSEYEGRFNREHVICLHSSLSSSKQWNELKSLMSNRYRVVAVDLYGYGRSPKQSVDSAVSLDDEIKPLIKLVKSIEGPIHLVGHSYGAMVALKLAQHFPTRVKTVSLFEPVMFSLLFHSAKHLDCADEISGFIHNVQMDYRAGNHYRAAEKFIDYWSGKGSWNQIPFDLKARFSGAMSHVINNFEAVLSDHQVVDKLKYLTMPIQLIYGKNSPKPVSEISKILRHKLSGSRLYGLHNVGHMGPVTHADLINGAIDTFIEQHSRFNFNPAMAVAA